MNNFIEYLSSRNLLKQSTHNNLSASITAYCGFDATSHSLHIGSLIPLKIMCICQKFGYKTIGLIGSATTLLGDPTWKNETRPMLRPEDIKISSDKIKNQVVKLCNPSHVVNNLDWFGQVNMLNFMRDIASHFSVNQLLSMETFNKRIREQKHLSAMEFYYPLLQAYDFKHLNDHYNCNLQIGGSDQWGNITQGISFVNKMNKAEVFGIIADLLVNSAGQKMGKSISGAVYLDESMYSVYDFWQFWRNVPDSDVRRYLLQLTDLPENEIKEALEDIIEAKKLLANSITTWVHGEEKTKEASNKSKMIFEEKAYNELQTFEIRPGTTLEHILVQTSLTQSLSEAKRMIKGGAVQVNDQKIFDHKQVLKEGAYVLRYGKKTWLKLFIFE